MDGGGLDETATASPAGSLTVSLTAPARAASAAVTAARQAHFGVLTAVAALESTGAVDAAGYGSTARMVQELFRVDRGEAARWVDEAADLCPRRALTGQELPAKLPASGAAAAAGLIGPAHIRVLRRAMTRIRRIEGLDPDAEARAERLLAGFATWLTPRALARAADHLVNALDPDGVAPPDGAGEDDELHIVRRDENTLLFKGRITDKADVEMIVEVLDALSAPAGPDDRRTLAQRQAEALKDLVAQSITPTGITTDTTHPHTTPSDDATSEEAPGDEAPVVPAPRPPGDDAPGPDAGADGPGGRSGSRGSGCPTVPVTGRGLLMITMDQRWLTGQIGHGLLDSGTAIDPATARRWACDAGIVPVVLGSRSEPLDVGRLSYTVPAGMRRALHHRDGGCAFPGCTRRPRRCAAHHIEHWADGGATALDNLALLCRFHHTVIHHEQWSVAMIHGRPWFTPPAWVDPQRTPRPGGRPHITA